LIYQPRELLPKINGSFVSMVKIGASSHPLTPVIQLNVMSTPEICHFGNGHSAKLYPIADPQTLLLTTIEQMGFTSPRPTLVLVGGASGMSVEEVQQLEQLFEHVVAPTIERLGAVVLDGGTNSGVMRLIGQARAKIAGTFPLLGVCASGTVTYPGCTHAADHAAELEPNHTHFLLVPGHDWGDESVWIAKAATAIAGTAFSCSIVVNGGNITWEDVGHSVAQERQTIVLDGSGRAANELAAELRQEPADGRAAPLVASGFLESINIFQDAEQLGDRLTQLLAPTPATTSTSSH